MKRLFFSSCLIIFLFTSLKSPCQLLPVDEWSKHPSVDSIFESMSITDRISQLLLIDALDNPMDMASYPTTFGGVVLTADGPVSFVKKVNRIQKALQLPAFIFSPLNDAFSFQMDSIIKLAVPIQIEAVSEPYLIYLTGKTIANQCRDLGIDGLVVKTDFETSQNENWRWAEMNQGFLDEGKLPINCINRIYFEDFDVEAFVNRSSVDMVEITPEDIPEFHEMVREALVDNQEMMDNLTNKIRQIIALKIWAGVDKEKATEVADLHTKLNKDEYYWLQHELAKASLCVVKNDHELFPIRHLENSKIASLTVGKTSNNVFEQYLNNYTKVDHFQVAFDAPNEVFSDLWIELNTYDIIIVGIYESEFLLGDLNDTDNFSIFMNWLNQSGKCITSFIGNPEYLEGKTIILNGNSLILAYKDNELFNALLPQLIFGGIEASGELPINLSSSLEQGFGIMVNPLGRFSYTLPEDAGLSGITLKKIDSIAIEAIRQKAVPGCQILVAKSNKVVFRKSYGFHTYDSLQRVTDDDLYDLASLTKVSGALPALMKLYEEGKFDLDATLGTYLKYYKRGNKKDITFREILAHQSGLKPYIVYWQTAIKKNGKYRKKTLATAQSEDFSYEVSPGLYVHNDYKEKIYKQIKKTKLGEKKYLYSGLTFFLFPDIIEAITGEKYEDYLYTNFYKPLGATTLTYNPIDNFPMDKIVPTEFDSLFRKYQVQGKVHDEGAAMMQGVSSNAGLFSNANDLAKLFQMYCNYGTFGGIEYLSEETIREFTRCQYPENDNRRALGFDRPMPVPTDNGNTAVSVSQLSFGHTGFTGTFAWADPEYNLVYIFLSNRVYPTRANTKLYNLNIRTNIQQVIYEAMR